MPSYSTTAPHSRRTSFDADSIPGGGGALDGLAGALASNRRPAYMTRFAMEDAGVHPRGPSPAYTPQASAHNSPNTHLVGLPENEALHPTTRAQAPLPSPLHGVLSPIQSATTSQAASRESSAGGIDTSLSLEDTPHPGAGESPYFTANGQRPVRHPLVNTQSFASVDITDPSSSNVSSDANDSDAQTLPRPWTSSHSQPQSMASSAVSSAASSIRDAPGVIGGNGVDHHPELALPSTAFRTTTVGTSNSNPSSPSLRPASALPSLNGGGSESAHSSTVRFGREASPLPSLSRGHTPPARTESQTRSRSRFSLGSALRGISQDLKDRLPLGSSHHHKDGGGGSSSNHRNRSVTPRPEDDEFVAPYGRGGAGAVPLRGRRKSPTRDNLVSEREESRSREAGSRSASRQRGRAAGMKLLTGAVGVGGDDDDGDDAAGWKEFRKGEFQDGFQFRFSLWLLSHFLSLRCLPLPDLFHHPRHNAADNSRRFRQRYLPTQGCRPPGGCADVEPDGRERSLDGCLPRRRRHGRDGEHHCREAVGGAAEVSRCAQREELSHRWPNVSHLSWFFCLPTDPP